MKTIRNKRRKQKGIAMVAALIFVTIFSAISVGLFNLSNVSVQVSNNHHKANHAFNAAQSGLECARYVLKNVETFETGVNTVSDDEADTMWTNLCTAFQTAEIGGVSVGDAGRLDGNNGDIIQTSSIPYGDSAAEFQIKFYRYDSDPRTVLIQCVGEDEGVTRTVQMGINVTKDAEVLNYALAGRGRMWLTGDTTIHGDVYSAWDRADIAPFNATSETVVEGSYNTVIGWQDMLEESYQMQSYVHLSDGHLLLDDGKRVDSGERLITEDGDVIRNSAGTVLYVDTLDYENIDGEYNMAVDSSGNPITGYVYGDGGELVSIGTLTYGNPVEAFDSCDDRVYDSDDELQGTYETMNYNQPNQSDIPGLDIEDYNTDLYKDMVDTSNGGNGDIPAGATTCTEYFPHASGDYSSPSSSSSRKVTRHVYENMTFSNVRLPDNRNALFKNCTFEDVLYIDCYKSTSSYYNNVRFEDCEFNGVIVTDTPSTVKWQYNALYFTGEATFNNQSDIQEATILAPHFNVDLGNTNPEQSDNNVITGAIVGGIVDVRGNAQIYGTIISMFDTTNYSSGFVTNIGATLEDGGSETTDLGDIGTIEITPDTEQMLPSGITSPVILKLDSNSYSEIM